jgi:hypothetical protein
VRPALWIGTAIFIAGLAVFSLVSAIAGVPIPKVHDEFSYLLAGDTFAHGRLTNPPPRAWQHFETFHVLQQPTYQSKYPPGQGLFLALGQLLWRPILGVWISTAAACAALFWCLSRWVPLRWATAGAVATMLHPLVLRWSQSYWGGSVALLGGALVIGAIRHPTPRSTAVAAVGAIFLANSRPYEGFIILLLAAPFLFRQVRLGAIAVLIAGAAWMGYYNYRLTGSPVELPYVVHERQYAVVPLFIAQELRPAPVYRHTRLREFYAEWAVSEYRKQKSEGFLRSCAQKLMRVGRGAFRLFLPAMDGEPFPVSLPLIYLSAILAIPLIGSAIAAASDRSLLILWLGVLLFAAALAPLTWLLPHYAAPAGAALVILLTAGLMRAAVWPGGRFILVVFALVWFGSAAYSISILRIGQRAPGVWANAVRRVEEIPRVVGSKPSLIVVRYPPQTFLHYEWVYNGADVEHQPIVWAREMKDNSALMESYRGRDVWLLTASDPPGLTMVRTRP